MNLRIAICDENSAAKKIYNELCMINKNVKIDKYSSIDLLIRKSEQYNVVFFNIDLVESNKIEVVKSVFQNIFTNYLVIISQKTDFIQDAFKIKAFRFLTKPIKYMDLNETISSIEEEYKSNIKFLIKDSDNITSVPLKDIICIEAFGDGTYIYTKDSVYTSSETLKTWASRTKDIGFFQVHRSYIVSFDYVINIYKYTVKVKYLKMCIYSFKSNGQYLPDMNKYRFKRKTINYPYRIAILEKVK